MARKCEKTGAKAICSLEQTVYVLLNDKSRMKGDFQVRFREKFEVKVLLLTRLRCCMRSCEPDEAYDIDINPDDIDVTHNVTVVWVIK